MPDGRHVVSSDEKGKVQRWGLEDAVGTPQGTTINAGGRVDSIVVSKDGRWIVTAIWNTATLWDARTHEKLIKIKAHKQRVTTMDVSRDSTRLATGSWDKTVLVRDIAVVESRRYKHRFGSTGLSSLIFHWPVVTQLKHNEGVDAVTFSPDGDRVATASRGEVFVWNSVTGDQLFNIRCDVSSGTSPVVWSGDGLRIFATGSYGSITCLDISTKRTLTEWSTGGKDSYQSSIILASNGKFIASFIQGHVTFWDMTTHDRIGPVMVDQASAIALSPNDEYLACATEGKKIIIWRLRDILPQSYFDNVGTCTP